MKDYIERHPFWFALLFTIIVMQLCGFVVVVLGARILGFPMLPVRVVAQAVTTIIPLILIWRVGWLEDVGLVSTTQNVYSLAVPVILTFFPLVFFGTSTMEPQRVNMFLLAVLFTGISEEIVYRGLFVRAILPYGKWKAVLFPAAVFAAAHIVNSLGGGMPLQENLTQIANAFFYGLMFGAVRLRINNVWPLIILHTLIDLFWVTSGLPDGVYLLSDIPLTVYFIEWVPSILVAIYLMRKSVAATIDGEPVSAMRKPVVAPAAD